jgi:hypothetical protein
MFFMLSECESTQMYGCAPSAGHVYLQQATAAVWSVPRLRRCVVTEPHISTSPVRVPTAPASGERDMAHAAGAVYRHMQACAPDPSSAHGTRVQLDVRLLFVGFAHRVLAAQVGALVLRHCARSREPAHLSLDCQGPVVVAGKELAKTSPREAADRWRICFVQ